MGGRADTELLLRWREGNAPAGDELVRRYYVSVRRFFDIKAPVAAEDLTQRTFLACAEDPGRFRGDSGFRAYLFGIARITLLNHLAARRREEDLERFADASGRATITTPTGVMAMRQEQRLLLRALVTLSTDMQLALMLHYWEGMKNREIAEVLQLSVSAVTTRISRAREKLREAIPTLTHQSRVRDTLLADLEGWARSMVPVDDHGSDRS